MQKFTRIVCLFVLGHQRDGSPSCRAHGGEELAGTGGLPHSEQVGTRSVAFVHTTKLFIYQVFYPQPLAWRNENNCTKHCVLLHSNCLEKRTAEGNTALHYSVLHHKPESLKLLLKGKAALHTGAQQTRLHTGYQYHVSRLLCCPKC